ncbi:MAG: hypothetical protein M3020_13440 [Myxococcota bacterium]|nr:hypothetical protein [Myxococcota bacterium]
MLAFRLGRGSRWLAGASTLFGVLCLASEGSAQPAPPPAAYPPAAYPVAPGVYPVAYPYPVPAGSASWAYDYPPVYPYRDGMPLPPGYHLEERPRRGLVIAGWLTAGIPYALGLTVAASADFGNESGWLAVPFVGPWLTLGRRDYGCDEREEGEEDRSCLEDTVVAPLILSGIAQTAGGTLLLVGYLVTKNYAVRNDVSSVVLPSRVGSGYGLTWTGGF